MSLPWSRNVPLLICIILLASTLIRAIEAGQSPLPDFPEHATLKACHAFTLLFPALVSFPADRRYQSQQNLYWAAGQADFTPTCRLSPTTSEEASSFISHLISFNRAVPFSISSGGHATAFAASNLNDGITLDLSALNSVALASDHSFVDVGTGARWADVYQVLDPLGLTVAGGRAGSVGVGGYLLGGGISIFSSLFGWGADSLESIEVVLPNGTIVTASNSGHSDLFTCLKGGANNFGLATRFRLKTVPIPDGLLDVTFLSFSHEQLPDLLAALAGFARNAHLDVASASAELSIGFDGSNPGQGLVYVLMLASINSGFSAESNSKADAEAMPPLWKPFLDIPALHTSRWRPSMGYLAQKIEMDNPYGFRVYKNTLTVRNDGILLDQITDIFTTAIHQASNNSDDTLISASQVGMLIQPLTLPHLHHARAAGQTNLMGLEDEESPLILLAFEIHYLSPADDEKSISLLNSILSAAEALASAKGALHPFRYVNYAAKGQDVWALVKEKGRLEQVKGVQARYDPNGAWEGRISGGFRIG